MSQNHNINIHDDTYRNHPIRIYEVDGGWHSAMYLEDYLQNELIFQYMIEATQALHKLNHPKEGLLIGGGMYNFIRYTLSHNESIHMDVAEIDETTLETAKRYFDFDTFLKEYNPSDSPRLNIYFQDGREFLEHSPKQYDLIFNDAYDGVYPVQSLLSKEFIQIIQQHLSPNGIYVANLPGYIHLKKSKLLLDEIKTLEETFSYVNLVCAKNELSGVHIVNYVVFASNTFYQFENTVPYTTKKARIISDNE